MVDVVVVEEEEGVEGPTTRVARERAKAGDRATGDDRAPNEKRASALSHSARQTQRPAR
jgi:hypothetical protein